jgi:hypothetical protein
VTVIGDKPKGLRKERRVVDRLNELLHLDPNALLYLTRFSVPVNRGFANSDLTLCRGPEQDPSVSFIGILNSVLASLGIEPVAAKTSCTFVDKEGKKSIACVDKFVWHSEVVALSEQVEVDQLADKDID